MNISDQMGSVYDRDTFIEFLNTLANDFEKSLRSGRTQQFLCICRV